MPSARAAARQRPPIPCQKGTAPVNVLVINSGSSSVKYEVFSMAPPQHSLVEGEVERIGEPSALLWQEAHDTGSWGRVERPISAPDHHAALGAVLESLDTICEVADISIVGHRVVHGGDQFDGPALIDDDVVRRIGALALLAPLHTSANLAGIDATRRRLPDVRQVAVFDTTFHRTMPERAREYALPRALAREHGIRRYGFHGTSHSYVARRAARFLGRPIESLALITLHLGNGASAAAIRGGASIDTSMGMTPLEGLVMGTRCGDVDPAVPLLLRHITGRTREDVHRLLNHESGLLGLCGESDMREVHRRAAEGDSDARLALDMFCYRAKKYVGAYYAVLGHVDALVFTAGIGEKDPEVRAAICAGLERLGIEIDEERNTSEGGGERAIHRDDAEVPVLVIPTEEELEIAREAVACVLNRESRPRGPASRGARRRHT